MIPPPGVFVTQLPNGAVAHTIYGNRYFHYRHVWYQPFYSGSDVTYETVADPWG